ncbi:putative cytoplasmic protein [Salmonella enterica subsp. enterica]|nr:putative cytoplasmic protein [Salmonella enterica subsp. enterica]
MHTGNDVDMVYSHMALKFCALKLLGRLWHRKGVNTSAGDNNENFPTLQPATGGEVREGSCSVDGYISRMLALLEFDKGKILIPKVRDKQHLSVMGLKLTVRLCVCKLRWRNQKCYAVGLKSKKKTAPESGAVDVSGKRISGRAVFFTLRIGQFRRRYVAFIVETRHQQLIDTVVVDIHHFKFVAGKLHRISTFWGSCAA